MKKTYETPQIIVTAFEGENVMLDASIITVRRVRRTERNTISFGQLN